MISYLINSTDLPLQVPGKVPRGTQEFSEKADGEVGYKPLREEEIACSLAFSYHPEPNAEPHLLGQAQQQGCQGPSSP